MDNPNPELHDLKTSRSPPYHAATLHRITSAPEPRTHHRTPVLSSHDHAPRKRDSPMGHSYQSSAAEHSPPSATHLRSLTGHSPQRFNTNLPDKRPRFLDGPERRLADPGAINRSKSDLDAISVHPLRKSDYPRDTFSSSSGTFDSSPKSCAQCFDSEDVVDDLVQGFLDLRTEICLILSIPHQALPSSQVKGSEVTKLGLKESLAWTVNEIKNTVRLVRGNAATKPGLPPLADVVSSPFVSDARDPSGHIPFTPPPNTINDLRRLSLQHDPPRLDTFHRRGPDPPLELTPRTSDQSIPTILQTEDMRRGPHPEHTMSGAGQSPHASSVSSFFGSAQSPMQSQPSSRTLPSPPGQPFALSSGGATVQYSPTTNNAAHNSHLQDLQHQISTKSLALQTLQREHDQLLAAFSRSQIRCTALDKKSQVSDHEINTLSEDKIRLQQQVEELETQVSELMKSRDEVHQQSNADGAQWRQIMAMSSQLQIKGADEARRFKQEKEEWQRDRDLLQRRIEQLESGKVILPEAKHSSGSTTPVASSPILTSDSVDALRAEIVRLRLHCAGLEQTMQGLLGEADQIDHAITAMENIRRHIANRNRIEEAR